LCSLVSLPTRDLFILRKIELGWLHIVKDYVCHENVCSTSLCMFINMATILLGEICKYINFLAQMDSWVMQKKNLVLVYWCFKFIYTSMGKTNTVLHF
jgi:hypothetical protein